MASVFVVVREVDDDGEFYAAVDRGVNSILVMSMGCRPLAQVILQVSD
jgi:hypothetical protein